MNKNEIYIKSGTNYKEMTKELLAQCGLASVISDKKMQIGIKPNLVSPSEASWGAMQNNIRNTNLRFNLDKEQPGTFFCMWRWNVYDVVRR